MFCNRLHFQLNQNNFLKNMRTSCKPYKTAGLSFISFIHSF